LAVFEVEFPKYTDNHARREFEHFCTSMLLIDTTFALPGGDVFKKDKGVASGMATPASPELDAPFNSQEVMETLNTIPVRKEPGLDGRPNEAYKVLGRDPELVAMLAQEATSLLSGKDAPTLRRRLVPIPKKGTPASAAAHGAAGFLRRFCPKLADLGVRLTPIPFEARVGDESFAVSTGVPQGSILTNDLSLRLNGAGGYKEGGVELGNLHFADDILQLNDSVDLSDDRLSLTKAWVEEWGGEIHPTNTQWLDINNTGHPGPGGLTLPNGGNAIDYLGREIIYMNFHHVCRS
jgi:hypothetical protein